MVKTAVKFIVLVKTIYIDSVYSIYTKTIYNFSDFSLFFV